MGLVHEFASVVFNTFAHNIYPLVSHAEFCLTLLKLLLSLGLTKGFLDNIIGTG